MWHIQELLHVKGVLGGGMVGVEVCIILFSPFWMISQCTLLSPLTAVYPSLESDDDDPALKSRPKKKKNSDDAPWSPKGDLYSVLKLCRGSWGRNRLEVGGILNIGICESVTHLFI